MLLSGKHLFEPQAYVMERAPDGSSHRFRLEFQSVREEFAWSGGLDGYTYSFNGRTYQDVESLWKEPAEDIAGNVQIVTDIYGEKVLKTYTQIPTFDSSDREWDSKRLEFLFFDGKNIHLVLMAGGYRIAKLTFYETLVAADVRMKPVFEKLGWKMPKITWLE
jgi:hypothetical protein